MSARHLRRGYRNMIVAGAALVAAVAMSASAVSLAALGRAVGWSDVLAWSLPMSVDVLALVAGLAWLAAGPGQSLGRVLTLITVAVSVLLNAVGHLVSTGHLTTGPLLVILVSAVPPLAAALAVHLGATVNAVRSHATDAPEVFQTVSSAPQEFLAPETAPEKRTTADHRPPGVSSAETAGQRGPQRADPTVTQIAQDRTRTSDHPHAADHAAHAARTTGPPPDAAPADHATGAADQRTTSFKGPSNLTNEVGPQQTVITEWPGKPAGHSMVEPSRAADHEQADHADGPAEEGAHQSADHAAPADHRQALDHPPATDHAARTTAEATEPAPTEHGTDAADQRTAPAADHTGDCEADAPAAGPQDARTTNHVESATTAQTASADQDTEVPAEVIEVARQAALAEGRMTRRAIRPHLRNHGIRVSNEMFGDLQARLHTDPALQHLPRTPRRSR